MDLIYIYWYMPKPMAAQHKTVTTDKVTFKLVIEWAVLGFRSQHRVSKYKSNPNNEMMSNAAGAEPNIPRLWKINWDKLKTGQIHLLKITKKMWTRKMYKIVD